MEVQYDGSGRLKYHPQLHPNKGKRLSESELEYLCKYYESDGMKSMSLALGRPEASLANKVKDLKKKGLFEYYKYLNKHW